ncbi:flavodoxin family protein [Desulfocurvibacter africanus]|uniref:flavodoxin family protein n=1 Tax=Desulfocurvibacter africanus TaxID=873 RepID=UPI0003F7CFCC|nr:flavodoxin family protein [Desulfocurvibacter africanus]
MKAIAINGSPRKKWNTATLLENALAGAKDNGAETRLVHLYDLAYKGCISCFACKKIGGKSYGRCAVQDELTPILDEVAEADVLILGSPFYFRTETGEMRSFMERLLFPYLTYTPGYASIFPGKIQTGLVYTMNVPAEVMATINQDVAASASQFTMARTFGNCETLLCTDTYQFDDYSKYLCTAFDAQAKAKRREEVFPQDCARAYELGAKLTQAAKAG